MMASRIDLVKEELGAGCIVNLHRDGVRNCLDGCVDTAKYCKLDSGSYGHPVLVLGVRVEEDSTYVTFVIISALGNDFPNFKTFLQKRACHLGDPDLLTPCSFGPKHLWKDEEKRYQLDYAVEPSGVNFTKRCYLLLPHRYTLKIDCFATFRPKKHQDNRITEHAYALRFTETSYNKVMEKMGLAKDNFVSTDDLKNRKGGATGTRAELSEPTSTPGSKSLPLFDYDKRLRTPTHSALAKRR
ncbi:18a97fba-19ff-4db6-8930-f20536fa196d [Sclerotinia trifoliorum]|uniref:18a97fba-19ff-4db6-8930-f20536fa196d n=1 Tax=Sclerotinia trifoliorum TaxID=28548 RepID=A0A8H2VUY7_9HELO|nr:18a97fba-19ff-4db6-8930-f20536fa196d [Sclerotinia trifoliorum]